jgi:sugar diacid utilization regulator
MSDELAVLELLAREASPDEFDTVVSAARQQGVEGTRMEALERAKRLCLMVHTQLDRHQQRGAALTALVDTARELATPHDLDTLLNVTTRRARLLLRADMAYISLPDEERGGEVCVRAADGHTSTLSVGLRLPATGGVGSVVLSDPAPFWTPDYLADQRFPHSERIDEVVSTEGLHAIMAVPLSCGTTTFGVLYVAERSVRHFKVDEISLLSSLASLAGVMIDKAQRLRRASAEANELHRRAAAAEAEMASLAEFCDTHHQLIDLVLRGGDLLALAEVAGRRLDGAVRLCTSDGRILAATGDMPDGDDAMLQATMDAHAAREPVFLDAGMWAAPIFAGNEHLGTVLLYPNDVLTDRDKQLLRLVTQAAAVLVLLDSKAAIAEDSVRSELLDDLLANPPRPMQQLKKRARRLGVDLDSKHIVVLARTEGTMRGKGSVWASSYAHRMGGLNTIKNSCIALLLPGTDPGAAARAVSDKLSPLLGQPVTVSGAGPVSDPGSVRHGFLEASRCLDAMTLIGATGRAASVSELGFVGVLLSDSPDVEGFIEAAIGPVLGYDRQRSTVLTQTLSTYFETGCSPTYSAEKLHVHPNTVARRLERVGELLGSGWQRPERSLEIQLALRLFRLRHLIGGSRHPAEDGPERHDT